MNESSCVYYKTPQNNFTPILLDLNIGNPGSVEFNFDNIWKFCKERRNYQNKTFYFSDLQFIHVHPTGSGIGVNMSSTDVNCLEGFVMAFGGSPVFRIIQFENDDIHDLTGIHQAYFCRKRKTGESRHVMVYDKVQTLKELFHQSPKEEPLIQMLKLLSYKN